MINIIISTEKPIKTQPNFILNIVGENLDKNNMVFTIKKIVQNFFEDYSFLLETLTQMEEDLNFIY